MESYLDLLSKDIKKNILQPYQEQIKNDREFFAWILGMLWSYRDVDPDISNHLQKIFKKYNIKMKFYEGKFGTSFKVTHILDTNFDLLTELLQLYIRLSKNRKRDFFRSLTDLNRQLKIYNIPLRAVDVDYEQSDATPGEIEILQFSNIKSQFE